jgi:CheY-like chemotaxis protein
LAPETVLVVDEQRCAEAAGSILTKSSYRVLTAGSGEHALAILQEGSPVELVLSEVLMPEGISGVMLAARIRDWSPRTAVMLMASAGHPPLDPTIPLLMKPFSAALLLQRVDQVLAAARRSAELLTRTFEANRAGMDELLAANRSVAESVRVSRRQRCERFCARLRTAIVKPTIVVAEDDPALRYSICRYLNQRGFRVLEAADGAEVLNVSREHAGHIDVLLTDIQMPGLNGVELADAIAAERPQTGVIFMTSDEIELPRRTLRKPFELDDLLAEIVGTLLAA